VGRGWSSKRWRKIILPKISLTPTTLGNPQRMSAPDGKKIVWSHPRQNLKAWKWEGRGWSSRRRNILFHSYHPKAFFDVSFFTEPFTKKYEIEPTIWGPNPHLQMSRVVSNERLVLSPRVRKLDPHTHIEYDQSKPFTHLFFRRGILRNHKWIFVSITHRFLPWFYLMHHYVLPLVFSHHHF
jgi:hypothetical protein